MNISSKCDYACRAVVALAQHHMANKPITATSLAEKRNIPEKYLVHILLQLKKAGIVNSIRGAQGGYMLARPADTITLLDVVSAIDGTILNPKPSNDNTCKDLQQTWESITEKLESAFSSVTIQSILDTSAQPEMYFI
jgi:Rrf2 family protein